jgi:hypothetical protein
MRLNTFFLVLVATIASVGVAPPAVLHAQEVAPPAADETLIYIFRRGRFAGGGAKMWVALNNQTVARLGNKQYAVVRAKAGRNTLNLATTGIVAAAVAVDGRAGETVYLAWRLGDQRFEEIGAEEGRELVADAKQTKSIDEPRPNNEEIEALMNFHQLGLDVTRPATARLTPDAGHAVITIFRRDDGPDEFTFPVWSEERYLGALARNQGAEILVTPGEHFFFSRNVGTSLLRAQVEAGKHYYVWLDFGAMVGRVRLTPVARAESSNLESWLPSIAWIEVDRNTITDALREREDMVTDYIKSIGERARRGEAAFALLDEDAAY